MPVPCAAYNYRFVKVGRGDYPMLRQWLASPHIGGWWDPPDQEIALIEKDMDNPRVDMRIVWLDDMPFAFVQDYDLLESQEHYYCSKPPKSRSLDTFIGVPQFLQKGHAARYLRVRCGQLIGAGVPYVFIDPEVENTRAVRAYQGAGFVIIEHAECSEGTKVCVMQYKG